MTENRVRTWQKIYHSDEPYLQEPACEYYLQYKYEYFYNDRSIEWNKYKYKYKPWEADGIPMYHLAPIYVIRWVERVSHLVALSSLKSELNI